MTNIINCEQVKSTETNLVSVQTWVVLKMAVTEEVVFQEVRGGLTGYALLLLLLPFCQSVLVVGHSLISLITEQLYWAGLKIVLEQILLVVRVTVKWDVLA